MRRFTVALIVAVLGFAAACNGGGEEPATPAPGATRVAATPTPVGTAPRATASPRPPSTATPAETAGSRPDGTIEPLDPGDTAPKTFKPRPGSSQEPAILVDVRISAHPEAGGWERVVFEFDGPGVPGGAVSYRDSVTLCGSGEEIQLPGSKAALVVELKPAVAHDDQGEVTLRDGETELRALPGGTVRGGRQICDFEGTVSWAFGLTGEHNFKVDTALDPPRVILDVKR